jgi:hypothetical protein
MMGSVISGTSNRKKPQRVSAELPNSEPTNRLEKSYKMINASMVPLGPPCFPSLPHDIGSMVMCITTAGASMKMDSSASFVHDQYMERLQEFFLLCGVLVARPMR